MLDRLAVPCLEDLEDNVLSIDGLRQAYIRYTTVRTAVT